MYCGAVLKSLSKLGTETETSRSGAVNQFLWASKATEFFSNLLQYLIFQALSCLFVYFGQIFPLAGNSSGC